MSGIQVDQIFFAGGRFQPVAAVGIGKECIGNAVDFIYGKCLLGFRTVECTCHVDTQIFFAFPVGSRSQDSRFIHVQAVVVGSRHQIEAVVHHCIAEFLRCIEAGIGRQTKLGTAEDRFLVVIAQVIIRCQCFHVFHDLMEIIGTVWLLGTIIYRAMDQGISCHEQLGLISLNDRFLACLGCFFSCFSCLLRFLFFASFCQ